MRATVLLLLLGFLSFAEVKSQILTFTKEVRINTPLAVSSDRYGNLYTGDEKGNVYKFDSTGRLIHTFSSQRIARISAIEAWQTLQTFVFYRDTQQFTLLNRFLIPLTVSSQVNPEIIGFARAATLAGEENLWVFDDTDFSLKKYNVATQQLSIHVPLSLILSGSNYNINFMREYQNMLFVNDVNSGILVFDNLGNYKKKLPFAGFNYFGFFENELYYLQEGSLHMFHLYNLTERTIILPSGPVYLFAIVSGNNLILFTKNSFQMYGL